MLRIPKYVAVLFRSPNGGLNWRQLVEERQKGLEAYLKAILIHRDPCWRTAYGFLDFLAVPSNTHTSARHASSTASKLAASLPGVSGESESTTLHTPTSWMTEYTALQHILRSVRASLLKRDTLAQLGDAGGSRSAGVEAKRAIKDLKMRLGALEKGLGRVEGLGQGERGRREGMVDALRDEVGNVEKMAEAGVRVVPAQGSGSSSRTETPTNQDARITLLGPTAPTTRVFGRSTPQETPQTRPLDAEGLVQLQKTQMDDQDAQLGELSKVLQRQMKIGQEIGREVAEQNELLDAIEGDVNRVGGKLGRAKRQLNRYVRVLSWRSWADFRDRLG